MEESITTFQEDVCLIMGFVFFFLAMLMWLMMTIGETQKYVNYLIVAELCIWFTVIMVVQGIVLALGRIFMGRLK